MKTLALVMFMVGGLGAFADSNLFQNGNFADGIAHWSGNCHTAGGEADDSGATSGIVVNLRNADWVRVTQNFTGKPGDYILTITYTTTPGMTISQRPEDYANVTDSLGLDGLQALQTEVGKWCVVVVDSGTNTFHYWQVSPELSGSGTHTIKAEVNLATGNDFDKGFHLGFPPGSGTINLQSISLVPAGPNSTASN